MDILKFILSLSALKWKHTLRTVLQLRHHFPGSVIFNLVHVGIQYYTFIIILEWTLLIKKKKFAVKQRAVLYWQQQHLVFTVSLCVIFCCA